MNASEGHTEQRELKKAKILNRIIAKSIDFILIGILLELIPKAGYFAGLVYLLISDGLFDGKSVGKRLMGLKVVKYETGEICTLQSSIVRNFTLVIGYVLMRIPLIGFVFPLVILFFESVLIIGNDRGLRFGDEIAKTQVIQEDSAASREVKS